MRWLVVPREMFGGAPGMGAGFVEYITKHYVVHFTVVDGFKLVELTDGSKEASGDTHVFTLDPPPSTP